MNIKMQRMVWFYYEEKAHVIAISKSTYSDSMKEMKMDKRLHLVTDR
jgi:hypothetical protein